MRIQTAPAFCTAHRTTAYWRLVYRLQPYSTLTRCLQFLVTPEEENRRYIFVYIRKDETYLAF